MRFKILDNHTDFSSVVFHQIHCERPLTKPNVTSHCPSSGSPTTRPSFCRRATRLLHAPRKALVNHDRGRIHYPRCGAGAYEDTSSLADSMAHSFWRRHQLLHGPFASVTNPATNATTTVTVTSCRLAQRQKVRAPRRMAMIVAWLTGRR